MIHVSLITPMGMVFEGQVESLIAPGCEGFLGVLPGHAPIAVALRKGPLTIKQGGKERCYVLNGGILEVNKKTGVLILCDEAAEIEDSAENKSLRT